MMTCSVQSSKRGQTEILLANKSSQPPYLAANRPKTGEQNSIAKRKYCVQYQHQHNFKLYKSPVKITKYEEKTAGFHSDKKWRSMEVNTDTSLPHTRKFQDVTLTTHIFSSNYSNRMQLSLDRKPSYPLISAATKSNNLPEMSASSPLDSSNPETTPSEPSRPFW